MRVGSRPAFSSSSSTTGQLSRAQLGRCSRWLSNSVTNVSFSFPRESGGPAARKLTGLLLSQEHNRGSPLAQRSALQKRCKRLAQLRWARGDLNSSRLHRRDLVL